MVKTIKNMTERPHALKFLFDQGVDIEEAYVLGVREAHDSERYSSANSERRRVGKPESQENANRSRLLRASRNL